MSVFQTQFSLSLELTSLIPQAALAVGKTYGAAMRLARELQSSGSDIVIEEDLALLFGRCRIAPNLASSFRTVVSQSDLLTPVQTAIALVSGPGPTLLRALTESSESPFFVMVVQCSLLVAVHETKSLATALVRTLEREIEDAPENFNMRSVPGIEGVRGVLRAIEDQSSSFDWRALLLSVASQLDLPHEFIHQTIPPTIFQCLMTMLSSVQRFPEERMMLIETDRAICVLVVWAHHVLGLSVLVNTNLDGKKKETRFGPAPEQVILNMKPLTSTNPALFTPSVVLLSMDGDTLFSLREEGDEEPIDGALKGPAEGYARRIIESEISAKANRDVLIEDVMSISVAMASTFSQCLYIARPSAATGVFEEDWMQHNDPSFEEPGPSIGKLTEKVQEGQDHLAYELPTERLHKAAILLFKGRAGSLTTVNEYIRFFSGVSLFEVEQPPGPCASILANWNSLDALWSNIRFIAIGLSVVVFAFAHVNNLITCPKVPLYEDIAMLRETALFMRLARWDGKSPIDACSDDCFDIISSLMLGEPISEDLSLACLTSARGWSLYFNTITESDPARVERGSMSIRKGTPCRNNVRKHFVCDPTSPSFRSNSCHWQVEARPNTEISICNKSPVQYSKTLIGERGDSFLLSLRLVHHLSVRGTETLRRTGYDELFGALWLSKRTKSCTHISKDSNTLALPAGCITVSGFGDEGGFDLEAKVYICLTAGNKASRWRALLAIASCIPDDEPLPLVLLKDLDCCLRCAIDQALVTPSRSFLVL